MTRRTTLLLLALLAASACASGADQDPTPVVACEPDLHTCLDSATARVCAPTGDAWLDTPCEPDQRCLLGLCSAPGDVFQPPDAGDGTPDTGRPDVYTDTPDTDTDTPDDVGPPDVDVPDTERPDAAPDDAAPDDATGDTTADDTAPDATTDTTPDTAPDTAPDVDPPDLCDPDPCTAPPGPCQTAGTCDPDSGQCAWPADPLCAQLTGSWRWTFTADADTWTTRVALQVDPGTGDINGYAIDRFGLAALTGSVDARDRSVAILKDYVEGSSGGTFTYAGDVPDGQHLQGTWAQSDAPTNQGTFSATRYTLRPTADAAGTWVFAADYADIAVTLSVDPDGLVSGTMRDRVGDASVFGVFDRGDGALTLRKVYDDTGVDWWYTGTVNDGGDTITGGAYTADSNGGQEGVWTGRR